MNNRTLIVVVGATATGKTAVAVAISQSLGGVPILSCDSRQFYREMSIGTAVPTAQELACAPHHFVHCCSVEEPYNAGSFEQEALKLLEELFETHHAVIMVGGSGMYVDALCKGFDDLPQASQDLRNKLSQMSQQQRLEKLHELDPEYYKIVDQANNHRVQRALEVCMTDGRKYSDLRTGEPKQRNFKVLKIGITLPRPELYERINHRVDLMMEQGLLDEASNLYNKRTLSPLQTVGYREIFDYLDGNCTLPQAVELIKRNTRRYAKRQTTWFTRDTETQWFSPHDIETIMENINTKLHDI